VALKCNPSRRNPGFTAEDAENAKEFRKKEPAVNFSHLLSTQPVSILVNVKAARADATVGVAAEDARDKDRKNRGGCYAAWAFFTWDRTVTGIGSEMFILEPHWGQ
jgi:hypothetical protein